MQIVRYTCKSVRYPCMYILKTLEMNNMTVIWMHVFNKYKDLRVKYPGQNLDTFLRMNVWTIKDYYLYTKGLHWGSTVDQNG